MRLISYDGGFGRIDDAGVTRVADDVITYLQQGGPDQDTQPHSEVTVLAPVPRPGKIICVGLNYRDHAAETGKAVPTEPVLFAKFANSVVGDGATVTIPAATSEADWEAELGVVIGRGGRDIAVSDALDHVGGYTCINDLSARDLQRSGGQWTRGKAIDGFLPMGPYLVTPDEVGDPQNLQIRCLLNGEVMQDSSTSQMVFGVAELISIISQTMTLEPGDVLATGTPPGVGMAKTPPRFLRSGDELVVEIERVGRLVTKIA